MPTPIKMINDRKVHPELTNNDRTAEKLSGNDTRHPKGLSIAREPKKLVVTLQIKP